MGRKDLSTNPAKRMLAAAGLLAMTLPAFGGSAAATVEVYKSPIAAFKELREAPVLAEAVAAGSLPPITARVPETPRAPFASAGWTVGKQGGELNTLVGRAKDTRLLVVYGYARLVVMNDKLDMVPDILERLEVEDGRIFTFYLRKGHRWSDGAPFTSEDFRYYWEDVANNEQLAPSGPPATLKVRGALPQVDFLDETTLRYSWPEPNPFFLPALSGATPLFIYRPAHYLKQFHGRYGDQDFIDAQVEAAGARNWAQLHNRLGNLYKFNNPDLPTLQPWFNSVAPPSQRFIAKRNPYYHVVDELGQQLPYADRFILNVVGGALIPAKAGAGDSDLQARGLNFADFTFLKESEKNSDYSVRLWRTVRGSQLALYPNLNANDPMWRKLIRDVRFRRALSLAIDRTEINQVIYYGLSLEGNNGVLPDSPLYEPANHVAWAQLDLDKANALLDEIGLKERNSDGIRLLPDGSPLEIIVETAGENTEEVDVLELIHDSWMQAGVKLFTKPSQREVLRNRIFSGETKMAMWFGYENGVPSADMSPEEFVPIHQQSYHWPKWGQYAETGGASGEAVDMELPKELLRLNQAWMRAKTRAERGEIWRRILKIHADEVYTIGLVAQVPQPVVVSNKLRNVPKEAMYNWNPGAQFGIYRPEGFWLDQ
jgi:peptide/nickel transport system substrate-binding protein